MSKFWLIRRGQIEVLTKDGITEIQRFVSNPDYVEYLEWISEGNIPEVVIEDE